jgi:hypothetical protein
MPWKQGFKILLVDDSRDDTFFIRGALEKAGMGKTCSFETRSVSSASRHPHAIYRDLLPSAICVPLLLP